MAKDEDERADEDVSEDESEDVNVDDVAEDVAEDAEEEAEAGDEDVPEPEIVAESEDTEVEDDLEPLEQEAVEQGTVLPRVRELLTRITDEQERAAFERFFRAAAMAIERLGDLDTSEIEADEGKGVLWEQLPETVKHSLERLETFFKVVRKVFPAPEGAEDDGDFDFDFGESDGDDKKSDDEAPMERLGKTLSAFVANLDHDLTQLRKMLQKKAKGDERWEQLEQLGEFRGRSRAGIGEMVFLMAREQALVRKADVVPFYTEDVDASLGLRRSITILRNRVGVHRARLNKVADDDADGARNRLEGFHGEFEAFMDTDSYRSMRVVDRRSFLNVRNELADLIGTKKLKKKAVDLTVEGLSKFLDSLSLMNQRELLVMHDRDAISDTERHLNAVVDAVAADKYDDAKTSLERAVQRAAPLLGREPKLDGLLLLFKHLDLSEVDIDDILGMAQLLRSQLE